MRSDETSTVILGAAVRALEAEHKEVTEESLLEATRKHGMTRREVKEFLAKAERGKGPRRPYPGYFKDDSL